MRRNNRILDVVLWGLLVSAIAFLLSEGVLPPPLMALAVIFWIGIVIWVGKKFALRDNPSARHMYYAEPPTATTESAPRTPQAIADEAMRYAGYTTPDVLPMRLNDIGVLAYQDNTTPQVCRLEPVESAATHVRPFMVLMLRNKRGGEGVIRFQMSDEINQTLFVSEEHYSLNRGQNFITPRTWLPLKDSQAVGRNWQLEVRVGREILALHGFKVILDPSPYARLGADGEIEELPHLTDNRQPQDILSLEELLQDQRPPNEQEQEVPLGNGGDSRVRRFMSRMQR